MHCLCTNNKIIVSSFNNDCAVGVLDLVHGPNRRFVDDVCSMMKSCDYIFLCNTAYEHVYELLEPIIGDDRGNVTDFPWVVTTASTAFPVDGEMVHIQDVFLLKTDTKIGYYKIWGELRLKPLEHKYIDQSDLVWCPGLETHEDHTKISDWHRQESCQCCNC